MNPFSLNGALVDFWGRERWFFICPHCGRTVVTIYVDREVGCRQCLNLAYRTETVSPIDRARLKLEKAQRQIEAGCRKGMRKTTYQRLLRQYDLLFLKEARKLQLLNEKRQKKENDGWGGGG